jgi:uncharacterized protein
MNMKIAVIGASGKQGNMILKEALLRGHDVTAIIRDRAKLKDAVPIVEKDLFDLHTEDIKGYDAVVDAFNAPPGKEDLHIASLKHLEEIFTALPEIRLIVVGGAGSLFVDTDKKVRLVDTEEFPKAFLPTASNMGEAFKKLQKSEILWTYLSPAAFFDYQGKRTGSYKIGADNLIKNAAGESYISYADYAVALVDEIEKKAHIRKRFTVVGEKA